MLLSKIILTVIQMNDSFKNHLLNALSKNVRGDGRKLDEFREIEIEYGISKTAEGSARVKFGDTEVVAGVKLLVSEPYPDTPDEGSIMVNAELLPLSNPEFEAGPPSIESIELARVIDRGIRESKAIDLKKLSIIPGEKCWTVSVDICTLNDDGNLLDASALAALAALKNALFPEYNDGEVNYKKKTDKKVPLEKLPISVTVFKLGNNLLVDPSPEEERWFDARLTVASLEDKSICALQKGGDKELSFDELSKMLDMALEKADVLRKHVS